MGFWSDITGKTAANASKAAAADTYNKQLSAVGKTEDAGNAYFNTLQGLAGEYDPYRQTGLASNDALMRLINDPSSVRSLPGYQFAFDEGIQALDRSKASRGMLNSGRAAKDLQRFGTGLADQTYGNQLQRLMGLTQQGIGATQLGVNTEAQGAQGQLGARTTAYNNLFGSAGTIGQGDIAAANARAAGAQNLLNAGVKLGGMALGGMGGFGGISSSLGGLFGGGANVPGAASNFSGYNMTGLPGF